MEVYGKHRFVIEHKVERTAVGTLKRIVAQVEQPVVVDVHRAGEILRAGRRAVKEFEQRGNVAVEAGPYIVAVR